MRTTEIITDMGKGSKRQMYEFSHNKEKSSVFTKIVGEEIQWFCPTDQGQEMQLNNKQLIERFGLTQNFLNDFWPTRSPQWDGLALGIKTNTLYLIEAKAHITEIAPGNFLAKNANDQQRYNYNLKCKTLKGIKQKYGAIVDDSIWLHKYYQISNRIAFLDKLKEIRKDKDVKLLFVNFINDSYWKKKEMNPTTDDWNIKYQAIFKEMGLCINNMKELGVNVVIIDCDTNESTELF